MLKISEIVIGDRINDGIYCLKSISRVSNNYNVVLQDRSGELLCELASERFYESLKTLIGGAVKTTFIVKNGLNTKPLGVIKSIERADEGSFKPSELFEGLSEEKITFYKNIIKDCMNVIKDENLRSLVAKILDEQMLSQLGCLPATIAYHGTYAGGALASTACVTKMVMQVGFQYLKGQNGLYHPVLNWDRLIAASLLMYVGIPEYYTMEKPFSKTEIGEERGYLSVLQRKIEKSNETVDDVELAKIMNILFASAPFKSGVKATSQEGTILRDIALLYEELDQIDSGTANHEQKEGEQYFYNAKLRRNIKLPDDVERGAA